jgi:hypothetical protein
VRVWIAVPNRRIDIMSTTAGCDYDARSRIHRESLQQRLSTMTLTFQAWLELLRVDIFHLRGFDRLHRAVSETKTRSAPADSATIIRVVGAVTRARMWYVRPLLCLHRSAAVTRLLRRHGVPAQMVLGYHLPPLRAHAWVEVAGKIVSDELNGLHAYHVLDRW